MNTKLTLTIDKSIIKEAKKYARGKGYSLSAIIENYLKMITKRDKEVAHELSPVVRSLKGSFKTSEKFDYKKELESELAKKYL